MFNKESIEKIITSSLRNKLQNYNPKPSHTPFHTSLFGKDRMALHSFIHSLSTSFSTAILGNVAKEIATDVFDVTELQLDIPMQFQNTSHIIPSTSTNTYQSKRRRHKNHPAFSREAQAAITQIMNNLSSGRVMPNHVAEIAQISKVAQSQRGEPVTKKLRKVDIFLSKGNQVFLIDLIELKTAKLNIRSFEKRKQDMIEWAAAILYKDLSAIVHTIIAMPYNPYEPEPYKLWTLRGMLDQSQLMVGNEFWNFLAGGSEIYQDLLTCFQNVGTEMRQEIDHHFQTLGETAYR